MESSEEAERKEVEKKEEETCEAPNKLLVDIAQRTSLDLLCVGKERRRCRRERQEEEQKPQSEEVLGRSGRWLFLLLIFVKNWVCLDAAAGRLEPEGKRRWRKSLSCPGWQKPSGGADGKASEKVETVKGS